MTFRLKGLAFSLVVLAVFGLLLSPGCARKGAGEGGSSARGELSGTIKEAGSTSVLPFAEALATEFMKQHPNVRVETGGGGSGAGVQQCTAGTVDLGAISRELKISEADLIAYPVARDAVAIIVNSANPVNGLKLDDVTKIYAGEITDWSQIGGTSAKITVIAREEGSGTRDCFEEKVMKKKDITHNAVLKNSNGEIQEAVSKDPTAIGFVSLGYISGVKPLEIDGVKCTMETCQKGDYPIVRKLYLITKSVPEGPAKAFIDFARSEQGQKIAQDKGYVPLVK